MTRSRVGLGALVVAGSLLAVLWGTRGWESAPPIYDGLPLQTEPYRYLQPAPGQSATAPPTSASENVKPDGPGLPFIVNTNEAPPQAEMQAEPDTFDVPASVQGLTITITPVPSAAPIPNGRLDGNVYRVAVTAPGGAPVAVRPGKHITVYLRGTGMSGKATMNRFSSGRWTPLPTEVPGTGFHSADSPVLGDFALVLPPGSGGLSGGVTAAIVIGAILVGAGILLSVVRLLRR